MAIEVLNDFEIAASVIVFLFLSPAGSSISAHRSLDLST